MIILLLQTLKVECVTIYIHVKSNIFSFNLFTLIVPTLSSTVINPCDAIPCLNGATCTPGGGVDFTCTCATGFTGDNCGYGTSFHFIFNTYLSSLCIHFTLGMELTGTLVGV